MAEEPAAKRQKEGGDGPRHARLRQLGKSGVQTTCLGLGGASLGDLFCKIPSADALETVTRAHELGVTYFDTAPWYGIGLSEARVGLALSSLPRGSFTLSTKVGRYLRPHANEDTWDSIGWAGGQQNGVEFAYGYDDVMRVLSSLVQHARPAPEPNSNRSDADAARGSCLQASTRIRCSGWAAAGSTAL